MQGESPNDQLVRLLADILDAEPRTLLLDGDSLSSSWAGGLRESHGERMLEAGTGARNLVGLATGLASASDFIPVMIGEGERLLGDGAGTFLDAIVRVGLNVRAIAFEPEPAWLAGLDRARDMAALCADEGLAVIQPADFEDARRLIMASCRREEPAFFRIVAHGAQERLNLPEKVDWGKFDPLRDGDEVTILATGPASLAASLAGEALAGEGIPCRLAHAHTVSPLDKEFVAKAARQTLGIVVAEPHPASGGLSAAVAELVTDEHSCLVRRACPAAGKPAENAEQWISGMFERIVDEAKHVLENA